MKGNLTLMERQECAAGGADAAKFFPESGLLPHGPHQLTREQVLGSQRARLLRAFTELLAEHGYDGVRIGELVKRAGVSRTTFYEHFTDKQQCLDEAYAQFAAKLAKAIAPEVEDRAPWSAFVEAAVVGYLAALQNDLTAARAFLVEMDGAGPLARARRRAEAAAFADRLAHQHAMVRARDRSLGPLPHRVHLALALAARSLVHDLLESEPRPDLGVLAPDILMLADAVVLGASAAAEGRSRQTTSPPRTSPGS
jgi:AcrR family transcriptional regulator